MIKIGRIDKKALAIAILFILLIGYIGFDQAGSYMENKRKTWRDVGRNETIRNIENLIQQQGAIQFTIPETGNNVICYINNE